ncbi:tRNA adenosine(34) deaminase TadA [Cellvibrio sp. ARAG 10.3]|uniref:tRNA adenosine(34) deaminase TadA n=1 Tax=Cellvibrio sp. ARAG 10.3 TaxID=3451358 RepID=UPI003F44FD0A
MNEQAERDAAWMRYAMDLAAQGEAAGEVPVGAVIVKDNQVIGEGWNQPISSQDPTAHAEVVAIRMAARELNNYRLPGCTLYVTLEPCTMCVGAMVHARIERLVFGTAEPKAGAIQSQSRLLDSHWFNHRVNYQGAVLATECQHQLSYFFQQRRLQLKAQRQENKAQVDEGDEAS